MRRWEPPRGTDENILYKDLDDKDIILIFVVQSGDVARNIRKDEKTWER